MRSLGVADAGSSCVAEMDLTNDAIHSGPAPIMSKAESVKLARERWLLFVQCAEAHVR